MEPLRKGCAFCSTTLQAIFQLSELGLSCKDIRVGIVLAVTLWIVEERGANVVPIVLAFKMAWAIARNPQLPSDRSVTVGWGPKAHSLKEAVGQDWAKVT